MSKSVLTAKEVIIKGDYLDAVTGKVEQVIEIPLDKIRPENIRITSESSNLNELAETIKNTGLLNPILVTREDGGCYRILCGNRRYRAFQSLNKLYPSEGYGKIPAIVKNEPLNDCDLQEIRIVENLQRENLTIQELEEALKYFKAQGLSYREIAEKIGKTEGYVQQIFSALNVIDKNKDLADIIQGNVDVNVNSVTISDVREVKSIPEKEQVELLKKKASGEIKTQKELRQEVNKKKQVHRQKDSKTYQCTVDNEQGKSEAFEPFHCIEGDTLKLFPFFYAKTHSPERKAATIEALEEILAFVRG